jgi:protein-disulfide isomerase
VPAAPVTVVVYADYQCPNCRQFATEVLPWLKETWMARGLVRVEYQDFAIRGEASLLAAQAAHCAGDQGRYWPFHDRLYAADAGQLTRDGLVDLAAETGLDAGAVGACLDANTHRARVEASTRAAQAAGFAGTPTYLINGRQVAGAIEVERWNELFQAYERDLALP